jgi:hypothetical protein
MLHSPMQMWHHHVECQLTHSAPCSSYCHKDAAVAGGRHVQQAANTTHHNASRTTLQHHNATRYCPAVHAAALQCTLLPCMVPLCSTCIASHVSWCRHEQAPAQGQQGCWAPANAGGSAACQALSIVPDGRTTCLWAHGAQG